jgi:hypothetical protein
VKNMRTVHWLFVVSVALFISGIAFVVAGGRTTRLATPVEVAVMTPVASIKQIMNGIVAPASTVIYTAVGTTASAKGVEETAPKNDKEWAAVGNSAAALAESGNLLLLGDRAVDHGDWTRMARELVDASRMALKAAELKSADGILSAGGAINETCDKCHEKYQRQ